MRRERKLWMVNNILEKKNEKRKVRKVYLEDGDNVNERVEE